MAIRVFRASVRREGAVYIAYCAELDLASEGTTVAEAEAGLREAVEHYFSGAAPGEIGESWLRDHRKWQLAFAAPAD